MKRWCGISILVGLGVLLGATGSLSAQDYEAQLEAALSSSIYDVDLGALREAYALTPQYDAMSDVREMVALATLLPQDGASQAPVSPREIEEAVRREFPLLETHYWAYAFYADLPRPNQRAMLIHSNIYKRLMDAVLATKVEEAGQPATYKVLTTGEEYLVLEWLELESTSQALVDVDGVFYDLQETSAGPVRFDISSFFGKN